MSKNEKSKMSVSKKNKKGASVSGTRKKKVAFSLLSIFVIAVLVFTGFSLSLEATNKAEEHHDPSNEPRFIPETNFDEILKGYTLAIIRPDHPISTNHGNINAPFPSSGSVLIPTNFMCVELCEVAYQIRSKDSTETLKALALYAQEHLEHDSPGGPVPKWSEDYTLLHPTGHKESAHEMFAYEKTYGKVTGECYAQACFNTAALRLSGFSTENVFALKLPGHVINLINADGKWWLLDSTYAPNNCLFEEYNIGTLRGLENDKYYVSFEHGYSNMPGVLLKEIITSAKPAMNDPALAGEWVSINDFIENAAYPSEMVPIEIPNTVQDAKTASDLSAMNYQFCSEIAAQYRTSQYDKALYALNTLNVKYPQVHAKAACMATWTQAIGEKQCFGTYRTLAQETLLWVSQRIETDDLFGTEGVAYPDIPILVAYGSTLDKALVAYGIIRNSKIAGSEILPEDVYIIVTEDDNGYLAVKDRLDWVYLNFDDESLKTDNPEDIKFVFNESEVLTSWDKDIVTFNDSFIQNIIIKN